MIPTERPVSSTPYVRNDPKAWVMMRHGGNADRDPFA